MPPLDVSLATFDGPLRFRQVDLGSFAMGGSSLDAHPAQAAPWRGTLVNTSALAPEPQALATEPPSAAEPIAPASTDPGPSSATATGTAGPATQLLLDPRALAARSCPPAKTSACA